MVRVLCVVAVAAACGSSGDSAPGPATRDKAEIRAIAQACASKVADSFQRFEATGQSLDVRALVCPAVYSRGKCAGAWIDALNAEGAGIPGIADACAAYCPSLPEPRPRLCSGGVDTGALAEAIRELDRAIVLYETGDEQVAMIFSRTKIDMVRMRDVVVR